MSVSFIMVLAMGVLFAAGIYLMLERSLTRVLLGFILLALVLWTAVENRRFEGPPTGDRIAKRKAIIAADEAAVGERT